MNYRVIGAVMALFLILSPLSAQTVSNATILQGLGYIRAENYEAAQYLFEGVLADDSMEAFHGDALYWLMKAQIARGSYSAAAATAYRYSVMYPSHGKLVEVEYQSARLFLLEGRPDKAIVALDSFMDDNPGSAFYSSALYWVGESLIELGRLEEADAVFSELIKQYPTAVKREAARYRRSEIALLYRERELLDLLKWSHEEYLQDSEDFYRRESEYRAAISSTISPEGEDADESTFGALGRLLDAKARLLTLQRYYVEQLLELSYVQ